MRSPKKERKPEAADGCRKKGIKICTLYSSMCYHDHININEMQGFVACMGDVRNA